jgi:hypothetical protein
VLGVATQENIACKEALFWQMLLQITSATTKGACGNFHCLCTKIAPLQVRCISIPQFQMNRQ